MNDIHIRNFLVHSFIFLSEVLSDGISLFFCLDATFTLNLKSTHVTKLNCYLHAKTIKRSNPNPTIGKREKAVYKDLHHRINYCNLCLSGDIEVNPGPTFVDSTRTIHVPYSQGNVNVFGENAGRQCVTMSLCSLIYVYRNGSILDSTTLVNIMNLGNELYSMVSRLCRQHYLLLTELPAMVTVEDIDYSLMFSESYTNNLHFSVLDEDIPFAMPLDTALEQLREEMFNLFLLTIEQVFDSHARDSFGMPHHFGTCVLLEFDSISNFTDYLKFMYRTSVTFELKVLKLPEPYAKKS